MRLNLGCGPLRLDGELGVDLFQSEACDIQADVLHLPFMSNSAEFVRFEHILEHFPQRMAISVLNEIMRVLQPGGEIRVGVPDLSDLCCRWIEAKSISDKVSILRGFYGNHAHDGERHMSGYDPEILRDVLETVGFEDVQIEIDHMVLRDESGIAAIGRKPGG